MFIISIHQKVLTQARWLKAKMVEPISATLTGIALARQGFEFLKNAKEGMSDAQQIGHALTSIFEGHRQFNEKRYSKSSISFGDVASEEIEYRNMLEDLDELRVLINRRYGHGTFEKIKQDYQERVRQQKEQEKLERQEQIRKWAKYREWFQTVAIILILSVLIVAALLVWKVYKDGQRELLIPTTYHALNIGSDNYKRN